VQTSAVSRSPDLRLLSAAWCYGPLPEMAGRAVLKIHCGKMRDKF